MTAALAVFFLSLSYFMRRRSQAPADTMKTDPDYNPVPQDPEDQSDFPSSFRASTKKRGTPLCPRSYTCRRRLSMMGVLAIFIVAGLLASLELGRRRGHLPKGKKGIVHRSRCPFPSCGRLLCNFPKFDVHFDGFSTRLRLHVLSSDLFLKFCLKRAS